MNVTRIRSTEHFAEGGHALIVGYEACPGFHQNRQGRKSFEVERRPQSTAAQTSALAVELEISQALAFRVGCSRHVSEVSFTQ